MILIRRLHRQSREILGYRRVHLGLRAEYGRQIGIRGVRRLMCISGVDGILTETGKPRSPRVDAKIPDPLQCNFTMHAPNQMCVTDLTECATKEGKLYQFSIIDLYDGTLAAGKTSDRPTAEPVTTTVVLAMTKYPRSNGVIEYSDHGSQYTSYAYQKCLKRHGLKIRMGRVRTYADNASAESVFGQFKRALIHRCSFQTRQEATNTIKHYFVETFNRWRRLLGPCRPQPTNTQADSPMLSEVEPS